MHLFNFNSISSQDDSRKFLNWKWISLLELFSRLGKIKSYQFASLEFSSEIYHIIQCHSSFLESLQLIHIYLIGQLYTTQVQMPLCCISDKMKIKMLEMAAINRMKKYGILLLFMALQDFISWCTKKEAYKTWNGTSYLKNAWL